MSQIIRLGSSGGGGTGTVTSISAGTGITLTPNPITTTGTVALTVPVAIANGGTNATSMTNTFGVNYFDGTRIVTTTVGTAGQILTSNGVGVAPTFQTGAGASITLTADSGGPLSSGSFTLAGGTNMSTSGSGTTITFNATGLASFKWSVITANQTASINNGYFCNKAGTLALALPAASAVGDTIEVTNENTALGSQFTQAAGQQILIGNTNTTLGATGTLTSSAVGDTLKIVCFVANTIWRVTSVVGNWSVV